MGHLTNIFYRLTTLKHR